MEPARKKWPCPLSTPFALHQLPVIIEDMHCPGGGDGHPRGLLPSNGDLTTKQDNAPQDRLVALVSTAGQVKGVLAETAWHRRNTTGSCDMPENLEQPRPGPCSRL